MLAVESARVCNRSPAKTAADFGTSLPFNQAAPFVYNMAVAVSPASIIWTGNTTASKQHTADRNADCDMGSDHSRISGFSLIVSWQRVTGQCDCYVCPMPCTTDSELPPSIT